MNGINTALLIYEKAKENRIGLTEMHQSGTEEVPIDIAIGASRIAEMLALELMRERGKTRDTFELIKDMPDRLRQISWEVRHW